MIPIPRKHFIENHPNVWRDVDGRFWLFQKSFKMSDKVKHWQESSDWDDENELCFGCRSNNDIEFPMMDEQIILNRGNSRLYVTVDEMLVPLRGFKWAALITINGSLKKST